MCELLRWLNGSEILSRALPEGPSQKGRTLIRFLGEQQENNAYLTSTSNPFTTTQTRSGRDKITSKIRKGSASGTNGA